MPQPSSRPCFSLPLLFVFLAVLSLLAAAGSPRPALAYGGGGGGDGGGTGGGVLGQFYNNPGGGGSGGTTGGKTGGNTGGNTGQGSWGPPPGSPPPPPDGFMEIDLVVPIRIEPVTVPENEPVTLVEIVTGINGHPTSGYIEQDGPGGIQRTYVLVDYRDIVKIVYDPNMGWVGISQRMHMRVPLPMTGFIRQVIANALSGKP